MIRKLLSAVAIACVMVTGSAFGIHRVSILSAQSDPSGRSIEVEGACQLQPSPRIMQLKIGHVHQISVAGPDTSYTWQSIDPKIATIESDGGRIARITGKGVGETQVIATAADGRGEARLVVRGITSRYTVVAWIDRTRINPDEIAPAANDALKGLLQTSCLLGTGFFYLGLPGLVESDADRLYTKAYLVRATANDRPPSKLDDRFFLDPTAYKLWNDFQLGWHRGAITAKAIIGKTPFPCDPRLGFTWDGEPHTDNGTVRWSVEGDFVSQINEGRIGKTAQEIEQTIDPNGSGTPWIWSVLRFDKTGIPRLDVQLFPTYWTYKDGVFCGSRRQADLAQFVTGNPRELTQNDVERLKDKEWTDPCTEQ